MNDIERAISEISDIRSRIAASTRFRGYAPEAVAMIGLASLGVLLAQYAWPESLAASTLQIVVVWGAVLLASAVANAAETFTRARSHHGGMAGAMLRGALRVAVPIFLVDVVVGVVVIAFAPEAAWLLPGMWQMLTGIVAFASYSSMPRGIIWPGVFYLVIGALVCVIGGQTGEVTPLLAGGPFVAGHLTIAWLLYNEGVSNA